MCPEAWLPFPLIKKVQCSVFDWAVLNPPTCCLLPYVTPPSLAHGILFTRAETTSLLLSGENSCTLIDETQFFDNIMFHICQTDPVKWYSSGLWVTMFQSVQVKRDSDESQGGREHYKKDRSNIIAVICAKFSVELVKAVKTSDTLFHSTIPLKTQWVF